LTRTRAMSCLAGVVEERSEFGLDRRDLGLQSVAVVVLVLVGAPRGEHPAGELQTGLPEGLLFGQSVGVAAEAAL
jgi:hypothetical protein